MRGYGRPYGPRRADAKETIRLSVCLPTATKDDDANRSFVTSWARSIEKVLSSDPRVRFEETLAGVEEAPAGA